MNSNRIIIHAGFHKTGTSSIQATLGRNRQKLIKSNIHYPGFSKTKPINNHSIPLYSLFTEKPAQWGFNIKNKITSKDDIENTHNSYIEGLAYNLLDFKGGTVVFSGENIAMLKEDELQNFKSFILNTVDQSAQVEVYFYVRDYLNYTVSASQQRIKGGATLKEVYSKPPICLYRNVITKFHSVFGSKNIFINSFEEAIKHEYGIVGHFLCLLDNHMDCSTYDIVRKNDSFSAEAIMLLSSLNESIPLIINGKLNENRNPQIINEFGKIQGNKFDLPSKIKKEVIELVKEDNDWMKESYSIDYLNQSDSKSFYESSQYFDNKSQIEIAKLINELFNKCQ